MHKSKVNNINCYCRRKQLKPMHYVSSWCKISCRNKRQFVTCPVKINSVIYHLKFYHHHIIIATIVQIKLTITKCVLHTQTAAFVMLQQRDSTIITTKIKRKINTCMQLIDQDNKNIHYHMTR